MNITYVGFSKLYKPLYNAFIRAYVQKYLSLYAPNNIKPFFEKEVIYVEPTTGMAEGITGMNTISLKLQDLSGSILSNYGNLLVVSHELCHAIANERGLNQQITKILHAHHGKNATLPLKEILALFTFRAALSRTLWIPKYYTFNVIDYNILVQMML